jgi:hypothetical protein
MANTITVKAYLVNGDMRDILIDTNPHNAIEEYFLPDTRPPVERLVIEAFSQEGKKVTLSITQKNIFFDVE